jgi:hypothetical protein
VDENWGDRRWILSIATMATLSTVLCAVPSCGVPRCVSFEGQELCRAHFIAACYRQLEECSRQIEKNQHWNTTSGETLAGVLIEIVDQAAALGLTAKDLGGLEQAQLLDILFTAGNLMSNLRRSMRRFLAIPLKVRYEVTGHNWTEEAVTQEVSLHGASFECRIPIAKGEVMTVERADNSRQTRAKVRWNKRKTTGSQILGIELLDCADFWGLSKV